MTAQALGLLSLGKWLSLAAAVLPLLLVLLTTVVRRARLTVAARPPALAGGGDRSPPSPGDPASQATGTTPSPAPGTMKDEMVALRAQLLTVSLLAVLVALPGELGQQIDDAVLALDVERLEAIVATVVVTVALPLLLWSSGRCCLRAYEATEPVDEGEVGGGTLLGLGAVGVVLLAAGGVSTTGALPLITFLVPGCLLVAGVALTLLVRGARPSPCEERRLADRVLWWVTAAPVLLVGLVALRSGLLAAAAQEPGGWWFVVAGLGALIGGAAVCAAGVSAATDPTDEPASGGGRVGRTAVATGVVALGVGAVGAVWPVELGRLIGAWAVVCVFCMLLLGLLAGLVLLGDRLPARGVLAVVGLRRMPFIAVLVLTVVGTAAVDTDWAYHDVRRAESTTGGVRDRVVPLAAALEQWKDQSSPGREQPLVLVAAAGGGIRAAYWTAGALSCLWQGMVGETEGRRQRGALTLDADVVPEQEPCQPLDGDERQSFFLASGISGGSVGLAVARALDDQPAAYTRALSSDFLGSNMAGYVFRDAPNSLARHLPIPDRAAVMEQAWEDAVEGAGGDLSCGLLASSYQRSGGKCVLPEVDESPPRALRFPLLALNSMAVDDGCRLVASALELGAPEGEDDFDDSAGDSDGIWRDCRSLVPVTTSPLTDDVDRDDLRQLGATRDVIDHSCTAEERQSADLPLSAAAHLSARFPYVSPSGRLVSCDDEDLASHALDGGLLESSGAGIINDAWPTIAAAISRWNATTGTCVVPRLLLLDNGYADLGARERQPRPLEAVAPIGGVGATFGSRSATARQLAALQVQRMVKDLDCDREGVPAVAHVFPVAHPGPQAPGWTLSTYSQRSLTRELTSDHNLCQYAIVHAWFGDAGWEEACEGEQ